MSQMLLAAEHAASADFSGALLMRSFLIGWLFWLGIALGSQVLVWLQELTGGRWGRTIRQNAEAAGQTLPILALGLIPLLLGMTMLYQWARPDVVAQDPILAKKVLWLNPTGFIIRSLMYFGVWLYLSYSVRQLRRKALANPTEENERAVRSRSALSLLAYGLTMTFAAIDWSMSLEPHWYSGIYGVIFIIGQALSGFAFNTAVSKLPPATGHGHGHANMPASRDLGNLLLAFTMLWTYVSFSQFIIIWMGDIPEEVVWYTHREKLGWGWLAPTLLILHFAVPFFLLLSGDVKNRARLVSLIAILLLVMRWFDLLWNVEPAFGPSNIMTILTHAGVALGMGVLWWPVFLWRRRTLGNPWGEA
jgi:hypothetical protein